MSDQAKPKRRRPARRKTPEDEKPVVPPDDLTAEAELLASHSSVGPQRILRILERAVRRWPARLFFRPALGGAFRYLEPEKALALLERLDEEGLNELALQGTFLNNLACFAPPLYRLDELEVLTREFIPQLKHNEAHLLRTGLPRTSFLRSTWLDWHLANLYFVKQPLCVHSEQTAVDVREHTYTWSPRAGAAWSNSNTDSAGVPYEDAGLIQALQPEDAGRLEASRKRLFDLKVGVLKDALDAVRRDDPAGLWQNCVTKLDALTQEEARFYLAMDGLYADYDLQVRKVEPTFLRHPTRGLPGGLTDLLTVVGHFEKELTIGTMASTRKALGGLIEPDDLGWPTLTTSNIFQAMADGKQAVVKCACQQFSKLHSEEEAFWSKYTDRVNKAVNEKLRAQVFIPPVETRGEFAPRLTEEVGRFMRFVKACLEEGVEPPDVSDLAMKWSVSASVHKGNVFVQQGEFWTVIFEGKTVRLQNGRGAQFIHHLLENPGREFLASDLWLAVRGVAPRTKGHAYGKMTKEELADENLYTDEAKDPEEERERGFYKRQLRDLDAKIKDAEFRQDKARVQELREERTDLMGFLTPEYDRWGRPRRSDDPDEQARQAITQAVRRTYAKLKKNHPKLYEHLNASITLGTTISYSPTTSTRWVT